MAKRDTFSICLLTVGDSVLKRLISQQSFSAIIE
nr:MAG TPA: hypothetical protein [Caudoviricetes sp.]